MSLKSLGRFLRENPFVVLLAALLIMMLGAPFAPHIGRIFFKDSKDASLAPFILILTVGAAWSIWPTAKNRALTIVLGGLMLALLYLSTVFVQQQSFVAIHLIGQSLFLGYVIAVVTRDVFEAPIVDGNILCGAACLYLLVGVLMGFLYCLVEMFLPGAFTVTNLDGRPTQTNLVVNPGWLVYFSFTTLTSVGFGDILPTSEITRSLSAFEAVVGQIMVVVMMARLVGLHVAQISSGAKKKIVLETEDKK
ncbi:ion channel [Terrimicrobium sacchariphilum]|uniref:Ion channel n=1 Tax=Terrimicrobium sacchariphilum TaxID=690879 RepID=A0A146G8W9_TERSA|nr:potassium channel family protein [Terrimicrobium sacchariphilum]GAT33921.1 ion channel [Terrimicrobium sacchariphilum]